MTFAFKLSRRLAQNYWAFVAAAALAGCAAQPAGPSQSKPVNSITITPATVTLSVNAAVQLAATLRDSTGNILSGPTVSWSSDAGTVASVSSTGLVRGAAEGSATITASSGGRTATASVLVGVRVGYYAASTGSSAGDGSFTRPWDLATALAGAGGRVQPGDTVWLRGGTYRGAFRSTLRGTPGFPIVVRQYPGERAIIDANGTTASSWYVAGEYSVFWGFEIINSDPNRVFTTVGTRTNVIANYASHTRYVNLVVHDGGVGFYNESDYADVEIVGCIWYNIGYQGSDRGHGHAIYLRSNTGPVIARDNIMFNQFGYGVHAYTNPGQGQLNNIRLEGNVAFNNGTLSTNSTSSNILMGGDDYATGAVLENNMTYSSPGVAGINVQVGYGTVRNGTVQVLGNYFVGASPVLDMGYWASAAVTGNSIIGSGSVVRLNDPSTSGQSWSAAVFIRDPTAAAWAYANQSYPFLGWQTATGLLTAGVAVPDLPTTTRVIVRPNTHEPGRANIVVYNWGRLDAVPVDLTGVLPHGAAYEIRNVQDLQGTPVASGTYEGGAVTLPMRAVAAPIPLGMTSSRAPATGIDFNVYVVTLRP
ncbi:MAG: Ig-like domain-containing protein [Gemmatimonadales bacterium]